MPDNFIDPTRALFDAFKALPRDTPIDMLNLVRYRPLAAYPEGHAQAGSGLTGAQAYKLYGQHSAGPFAKAGGRVVWRGRMETMVIGPPEERWDTCFIARYPHSAAFMSMLKDPAYLLAVVHRQAAVETSRLIRCGLVAEGGGFA